MKIRRNDPCPCGSGKKYKKCCMGTDNDPFQKAKAPSATEKLDALGPASGLLSAPLQDTSKATHAPDLDQAMSQLTENIDDQQAKELKAQMEALQSMFAVMNPKK